MAIDLDQITRKKLVLVKQLYQRAILDTNGSHSATSRILSVIEFDLAIETILKAIIGALDTSSPLERDFNGYIKQSNLLLGTNNLGEIPDKAHIIYVHRIRNTAQHQGTYPNESDVNDCRTYTRDFLYTITTQIWNINFENINLVELIEDENIKHLLLEGYKQFEEHNYSGAVDYASESLTTTFIYVEQAVVGKIPWTIRGIAISGQSQRLLREGEELLNSIKRMQRTLLHLALEMDLYESVKYREIVGATYFTGDNKHHRNNGKEIIDQNDAEFVLTYCTNTIIRIEERVGSLQRPLGVNQHMSGF